MTTLTELVQAVRDMPDQHEAYVRWADAWLADSTTAGPPPAFTAWMAGTRSGLLAQCAANHVGTAIVASAAADRAAEAAERCDAAGDTPRASGQRKLAAERAATRDACIAAARKTLSVCA